MKVGITSLELAHGNVLGERSNKKSGYQPGVNAWNFDLEDLKFKASLDASNSKASVSESSTSERVMKNDGQTDIANYYVSANIDSLSHKLTILYKVGCKHKKPAEPDDDMAIGAPQDCQFLKEFFELPFEKMDLKQALQEAKRLKNEPENDAGDCKWLKQFL
ncbi:hypothetical protein L1887_18469 [Cichorium endivia]|nr:hypothetical protein L1887_18469 [Cichorium endivia]